MLPEFDDHGNLPPGIHRVTLDEVVKLSDRLRSLKRHQLTGHLQRFCIEIWDIAVGVYIDGSYITNKLAPGDVDLLVVLPRSFNSDTPEGYRLLGLLRNRLSTLHVFVRQQGRHDHEIDELVDYWSKDRQANPKGIIYVEMRG